ncbi:MAG: helix-turn-helix domain-containing protein [Planctomycetes bacterium]|nr:helix-turn-helix domain-containing protein [Planctomycetota bacterium]
MDCEIAHDLLFELARGELDAGAEREVGGHLAGCPRCRGDVATVRRIDAMIREDQVAGPSRELTLRVKDAVAREVKREATGSRVYGDVLGVEELADYLRVDVATVYAELERLPAFEFGGTLLFRRASVDAWIASEESHFRMRLAASELRTAAKRGGA